MKYSENIAPQEEQAWMSGHGLDSLKRNKKKGDCKKKNNILKSVLVDCVISCITLSYYKSSSFFFFF